MASRRGGAGYPVSQGPLSHECEMLDIKSFITIENLTFYLFPVSEKKKKP